LLQPLDVRRGQSEPEHAVEKRCRLRVAEAKLTRADLGELAARAQSPERQRRILTGRNGDVKRVREALDEVCEPFLDLRVGDQVKVVEDKDQPSLETGGVVHKE